MSDEQRKIPRQKLRIITNALYSLIDFLSHTIQLSSSMNNNKRSQYSSPHDNTTFYMNNSRIHKLVPLRSTTHKKFLAFALYPIGRLTAPPKPPALVVLSFVRFGHSTGMSDHLKTSYFKRCIGDASDE